MANRKKISHVVEDSERGQSGQVAGGDDFPSKTALSFPSAGVWPAKAVFFAGHTRI
jgi:hypothetical protein